MNAHKNKRGSALLTAIVFATVLSGTIAIVLKTSLHESNIENRDILLTEARNAAESALQSGVAELVKRWKYKTVFDSQDLSQSKNPLTIPSEFTNIFSSSRYSLSDFEIVGGPIGTTGWTYIDPNDPANQLDPQKGKKVYSREIELISKAATMLRNNEKIFAYTSQKLLVRDTPLFSHAVFYNMDLEYHPGPNMNMNGPVHTNGNLWTSAVGNLYFHSVVSTAKDYRPGLMIDGTRQGGNVFFKDGDNNWISDFKGTGSKTNPANFYSSLDPNWREVSSNRWDGNLLTKAHGVSPLNLVGYADYVRDDPSTPEEIDDDLNYAYAIIEPNLDTDDIDYKGEYGEREKFARKAGLIIRVHETDPSEVLDYGEYRLSDYYYVTFNKLERDNPANPNSDTTLDVDGNVQEVPLELDSAYVNNLLKMGEYEENTSGKPISGFYDKRRSEGLDVLELDIAELRKAVDDNDVNYDSSLWTYNYTPEDDYNGVVYVEFPMTGTSGRPDKVKVSKSNLGLLITNGSNIPNPSYNNTGTRDPGFTLATNNALYVKGHYNADGNSFTGSSTAPDNSSNPEPPAALAADSITILSDNWNAALSKDSLNVRLAIFTEVNAGILQGLVPTDKGGSGIISGGNHNFPRFLEKWSGKTFRYRGSMVALFESEIANQGVNTSYYSPPIRDWGFYERFGEGYYPPGTPNARSFRTVDYRNLTANEYNTLKTDLQTALGDI